MGDNIKRLKSLLVPLPAPYFEFECNCLGEEGEFEYLMDNQCLGCGVRRIEKWQWIYDKKAGPVVGPFCGVDCIEEFCDGQKIDYVKSAERIFGSVESANYALSFKENQTEEDRTSAFKIGWQARRKGKNSDGFRDAVKLSNLKLIDIMGVLG